VRATNRGVSQGVYVVLAVVSGNFLLERAKETGRVGLRYDG
jgi:hypothetical protein